LKDRKIIVVDDELLIRDLLYDFFTEKNWQVSIFDTAESALAALKARRYDISLIDLKMPDIDGMSLIRKLRSLYPHMPTVIMTAFPSIESAVEALRLKVDDYVVKPFNINKLFKTLESLVEQKDEIEKPEMQNLSR